MTTGGLGEQRLRQPVCRQEWGGSLGNSQAQAGNGPTALRGEQAGRPGQDEWQGNGLGPWQASACVLLWGARSLRVRLRLCLRLCGQELAEDEMCVSEDGVHFVQDLRESRALGRMVAQALGAQFLRRGARRVSLLAGEPLFPPNNTDAARTGQSAARARPSPSCPGSPSHPEAEPSRWGFALYPPV